MDPVSVDVLAELIASAIAATAGKSWKAIRTSPEAKAVSAAIGLALLHAFRDASRFEGPLDDEWISYVVREWEQAFTEDVSRTLIRCLASTDQGRQDFADVAARALRESNCNLTELERTFW